VKKFTKRGSKDSLSKGGKGLNAKDGYKEYKRNIREGGLPWEGLREAFEARGVGCGRGY
jgi:hypothetical protein